MPTYNRVQFLREAVDSVLSQSYSDWELIISDDGSTDDTRAYLASLADPRIKVYLQPGNLGQFGNLNFAFSKASHEITQILCDDDYFNDDDALVRLTRQWEELPSEFAFLRANHSYDANSALSRFESSVLPQIVKPDKSDLFLGVFGSISGNLSNMSVRTQAARSAGDFRTDLFYAGDFEFWARLGRQRPWFISSIRVTVSRSHEGQVGATRNKNGEAILQLREILEPIYSNLIARGYSSTLLRLMFTINYTSQHRYRGLKTLATGGGPYYLRAVTSELDPSSFSFGSGAGWLIFFGSLGGKLFRIPLARRLMREAARK
jgi:glycosyltransferase involved in cell wall biosynthesis